MARTRFLHTGDLHLSRAFGFLPPRVAEERRRDQRRTLARIADLALERDVDFVLVSGDLFDRPEPDPTDLEAVVSSFRKLADAGKRIFAIPGNHDGSSAAGLWHGLKAEGLRVFTEPEYECEILDDLGVAIVGIAFDPAASDRRAFEDFEAPDGVACIVLIHASYESFEGQIERYHPFSWADLARLPATYVALGHYHRLNTIEANGLLACYPGTPEGLGFDAPETEERYVLVAEITDDGTASVEPVRVNRRTMRSAEIDCSSFESPHALEDAVRKQCEPNALVNIRLTGTPPRTAVPSTDDLESRFRESCFHLQVDSSGINLPADVSAADRTIRGRFSAYMLEQIDSASDPERKRLLRRALDLGLAEFAGE